MQIICWINPEDYWNIDSLIEQGSSMNYFGYKFEVQGGTESAGSSTLTLHVVELVNAHISVGLCLPKDMSLDTEFKLGFICQENPTKELVVDCTLTDEVKRINYGGDELEKLEYIGFSLEKFYYEKKATFYLCDLRGAGKKEE